MDIGVEGTCNPLQAALLTTLGDAGLRALAPEASVSCCCITTTTLPDTPAGFSSVTLHKLAAALYAAVLLSSTSATCSMRMLIKAALHVLSTTTKGRQLEIRRLAAHLQGRSGGSRQPTAAVRSGCSCIHTGTTKFTPGLKPRLLRGLQRRQAAECSRQHT
jgi:hypothetical protein